MNIRSAPYQSDNLFLCSIKTVDSYSTTSWSSRISPAFNCPSPFISTYIQLSGHLMPRTYCSSITRSPRFTWPSPLTSPISTQVGSTTAPARHRGGNALPAGQSSLGGRTAQPDNAKRNNNTHPVIFIFRSSIGGCNCMAIVFYLPVAAGNDRLQYVPDLHAEMPDFRVGSDLVIRLIYPGIPPGTSDSGQKTGIQNTTRDENLISCWWSLAHASHFSVS